MKIYADSSFFVSLYLPDSHTSEALQWLRPTSQIWFTPFHQIEFAHALAQQVFRRQLSAAQADEIHGHLARDCKSGVWHLLDFPPAAFGSGADLARRFVPTVGTRTPDTLHVASALELKAERFWTFDERQRKLARAAGLRTS